MSELRHKFSRNRDARLKRAQGHLAAVMDMMDTPAARCMDLAQQLHVPWKKQSAMPRKS